MRVRNQQWKEREIAKNHYLAEDSYKSRHFYQCLTNGTSKLGKVGGETGQDQNTNTEKDACEKH